MVSSTAGESLSFVKDFSKVNQWKRDSTDRFDPLTPSARFGKQADVNDYGSAAQPYLPTPRNFDMDPSKSVTFGTGWVIVAPSGWANLTDFLKSQWPFLLLVLLLLFCFVVCLFVVFSEIQTNLKPETETEVKKSSKFQTSFQQGYCVRHW